MRPMATGGVTIRRATPDDAEACHGVLWSSATDFGKRNGSPLAGTAADWWANSEPIHRFLAGHAAEWWVAEDQEAGDLVGYARSIERDGLFELTEFFVVPDRQSAGVGGELLDRAFPPGRGDIRSIIATTDVRALARYYRTGMVPRFPLLTFEGAAVVAGDQPGGPTSRAVEPDSPEDLAAIREIERTVLESARGDAELRWLLGSREGYLYTRNRAPVGFSFVGRDGSGPIAALDADDLPAILLHVEGRAAALGRERIEFEVPGPNEVAARHLLGRGYRLDPWVNVLMSNRPFGRFDRVTTFSPPLFL